MSPGFLLNPFAFGASVATPPLPGPPPQFIATGGTAGASGQNNVQPAYPAGIQADDLLVLFVHLNDGSGNAQVTSVGGGFSLLDGWTYDPATDQTGYVYWKRATGTESGTVLVQLDQSVDTGVVRGNISCFRGCSLSATPYEAAVHRDQGSTTLLVGSAITTLGVNRKVVTFFGHRNRNTTGTNTNGWTEEWESGTASGNDASESCNTLDVPDAGAVAAITRTLAASAPTTIAFTFALIPVNG